MGIVTSLTGFFLLFSSALIFSLFFIWIIGAKIMWEIEENTFLMFIQKDQYYCYLLPMMIPTTFILVYANWVSMKFFRHN